jgi:energy-coupling factor transporter ATP-binding protein EcfA2
MWIVKVWSEWELSCNDLFMSEEKARAKVARALEDCGLEESLRVSQKNCNEFTAKICIWASV